MYYSFFGPHNEYASAAVSSRHTIPHTKAIYLGKVIDLDQNVFFSQERGYFTFDLQSGSFGELPEEFTIPDTEADPDIGPRCLDFGDVFFVDNFLWQSGLMEVIDTIPCQNKDTLHALICFYMLSTMANCDCSIWYAGSVAKLIYPKANLGSRRISEFLAAAGNRDVRVNFLEEYSAFVIKHYCPDQNILIDSTGLPNSIHMHDTCVSVHNNVVSIETRLIFVVQKSTGLPIFYDSIPGNVVDKTTLERIFCHLNAMNINVDSCLVDAGYNTSANLDIFYDEDNQCRIGFITRASSGDKRFKKMMAENLATIESRDNFVKYLDRYLFIVKKEIKVGTEEDHPAWMYLGFDCARESDERRKLLKRAKKKSLSDDEVFDAMQNQGFFALISGKEYGIDEILPAYYQRQQIEQTFDVVKNYTKILPLREHNNDTYRGHLLLSFIASCAMKMIQLGLKTEDMFLGSKMTALRNQKCTIYTTQIITDNIQKEAREVYEAFGIDCPASIPIRARKLKYTHPDPILLPSPSKESEKEAEKPKKRGRPPGSKNKKTLEKEARQAAVQGEEVQKRGRGRPPGSKNKKTLEREAQQAAAQATEKLPKKRGRPPGSKNKKTLEKEAQQAAAQPKKRGRGRPPGSKNKKTLEREARLAAEQKSAGK